MHILNAHFVVPRDTQEGHREQNNTWHTCTTKCLINKQEQQPHPLNDSGLEGKTNLDFTK